MEACAKAIAALIAPHDLSIEVTSNEPEEMLRQAQLFAGWADNIVVKITVAGPNGELDNLEIAHRLGTEHRIRVDVTAMMSAQQAFLAALAGATYVSTFAGRVNDMGYNACSEIGKLRRLLDQFGLKSKIIVGSVREILNVIEWLEGGADNVTVVPQLLERMLVHPDTKETAQMFMRDAAKLGQIS